MDFETLIKTYKHCRANKRYSIDNAHFELHYERDLERILYDLNARDLVPFLYAFIRTYPRPREVNACQMPTKILQDFFDIRVRPSIDRRLTDRTFNNRIGYGPEKAVQCLQRAIRRVSDNYTRDAWVIGADIQAFFPSSDLQRGYDAYREVIEADFEPGEERWQYEKYGYVSHPRKRTCQHFSKGGYFLGYYFKFDRLYISNRVVRRCEYRIRHFNRMASPKRVDAFLSSINSYLGRMKQPGVYAYGIIRNLADMVSPKWLQYVHYNDARRCFQANPSFTHNELLINKYHFKLKKYGK